MQTLKMTQDAVAANNNTDQGCENLGKIVIFQKT